MLMCMYNVHIGIDLPMLYSKIACKYMGRAGMGDHFIGGEAHYGIFSVEFKSVFIGKILPVNFQLR